MSRPKFILLLALLFLMAITVPITMESLTAVPVSADSHSATSTANAVPVLISADPTPGGLGTAVIWDDAALSDSLTISMTGVALPPEGSSYEGWLVSDDGSVKKSTGILSVSADGVISHTFGSPKNLVIALKEQNDTGESGWVLLTAQGSQTRVQVNVGPGTVATELAHIHAGQCGDDLGDVAHGLSSLSSGSSLSVVDAMLTSLLTGSFAINLHEKDNAGNYTACGNIPAMGEFLTIALDERTQSGESGWATLIANGSQTDVAVNVGPGTIVTELAHIHDGQCGDNLGDVVHALTNLAGGASVTTVDATLASLRTGVFTINLHQQGNAGRYTACGNIPAGDSMYSGENLINTYNTFVITQEPVPDTDPAPASGPPAFSHAIPLDGMAHIRHLLADWPPGSGVGILQNLKTQLDVAIRHAQLAASSDTLETLQLHAHHVLNIIEGEDGPNFDASFGNPGDGIGVLIHAQDSKHGPFAANAVPDDVVISEHAALVEINGMNAETRALEALDFALKALDTTNMQLAKIFLGQDGAVGVIGSLQAARSGFDADGDGSIENIVGEGGAEQAYVEAQLMATYTLAPGAPAPIATPEPEPTAIPEPTATPVPPPVPTQAQPTAPGLPGVGDDSVPIAAQLALLAAIVLLGTGGIFMVRGRRSKQSI